MKKISLISIFLLIFTVNGEFFDHEFDAVDDIPPMMSFPLDIEDEFEPNFNMFNDESDYRLRVIDEKIRQSIRNNGCRITVRDIKSVIERPSRQFIENFYSMPSNHRLLTSILSEECDYDFGQLTGNSKKRSNDIFERMRQLPISIDTDRRSKEYHTHRPMRRLPIERKRREYRGEFTRREPVEHHRFDREHSHNTGDHYRGGNHNYGMHEHRYRVRGDQGKNSHEMSHQITGGDNQKRRSYNHIFGMRPEIHAGGEEMRKERKEIDVEKLPRGFRLGSDGKIYRIKIDVDEEEIRKRRPDFSENRSQHFNRESNRRQQRTNREEIEEEVRKLLLAIGEGRQRPNFNRESNQRQHKIDGEEGEEAVKKLLPETGESRPGPQFNRESNQRRYRKEGEEKISKMLPEIDEVNRASNRRKYRTDIEEGEEETRKRLPERRRHPESHRREFDGEEGEEENRKISRKAVQTREKASEFHRGPSHEDGETRGKHEEGKHQESEENEEKSHLIEKTDETEREKIKRGNEEEKIPPGFFRHKNGRIYREKDGQSYHAENSPPKNRIYIQSPTLKTRKVSFSSKLDPEDNDNYSRSKGSLETKSYTVSYVDKDE